ncbi:DNA polymerase III subunit chi [Candidatus Erwinia haradaeae]|uniref:DNA polymerase III subunit chi n=1 Tax=Candidatus Erwinia haradaeae TaxID=1922217 RepID=A0A451D3H8_9GAMM|nr:DNA polymerase III subunit chi [Candidatus Erwinia haradaeae]VFP80220.1 DNA polymerase III subunit chi [Candidatus Erwinia haradaeae]
MKHVTFYLLRSNPLSRIMYDIEQLVCNLVYIQWRDKNKRIIILCINKEQAIRLDEKLWQWTDKSFLPHNLAGEGPKHGAPVELTWPQNHLNTSYDLLINLLPKFIKYINSFHEVIDFVPYEESHKNLARERYKDYRRLGFNLYIQKL